MKVRPGLNINVTCHHLAANNWILNESVAYETRPYSAKRLSTEYRQIKKPIEWKFALDSHGRCSTRSYNFILVRVNERPHFGITEYECEREPECMVAIARTIYVEICINLLLCHEEDLQKIYAIMCFFYNRSLYALEVIFCYKIVLWFMEKFLFNSIVKHHTCGLICLIRELNPNPINRQ